MSGNSIWRARPKNGLMVAVMGVVLVGIDGCAGEAPKPVSTMTQDQVREHADKAFEKLKQEEKNRTTGSEVAPY
jgi:hypothetical protein